MRLIDLTTPLSTQTPAWPTYEPLQVKFFKRLAPNGANGQLITHSNHVGTHLDGSLHFCTHGRDIASIPLEELYGDAVVVDISDMAEDYGFYGPEDLMKRADIRKGDILIINTGYNKYSWEKPEADEIRYMVKHPGPKMEFAEWCLEMKFKWIGVDCGSADHPMNTKIRDWMPVHAKEFETKWGKPISHFFPDEHYQLMHIQLFPHDLIHAECIGGDINELSNKRTTIGIFPWRFIGGESCISRVVAFHED